MSDLLKGHSTVQFRQWYICCKNNYYTFAYVDFVPKRSFSAIDVLKLDGYTTVHFTVRRLSNGATLESEA